MKCKVCNSCVRLVRIGLDSTQYFSWYCDLCDTAEDMYKKGTYLSKDSEAFRLTKEKFNDLYRNNPRIPLR
jgi:hypothetical protein